MPLLASGQGKSELRGRIVSETGEAIAAATITLAQIGYAIRTDSTGAFLFAGMPANYGCRDGVDPRGVGAPPEYQPSNNSCGVVLTWSK